MSFNSKEYHRQYYLKHKEKWAITTPEKREAHRLGNKKSYYKLRPVRAAIDNKYRREKHRALRLEVLSHYSSGTPHCSCCGEYHFEFLAIDHIDGGGRKHVSSIPGGHLYLWIKANGFPKGFRILCHNCNMSMGSFGYCPHEAERASERVG